jgi:hypothetical protein
VAKSPFSKAEEETFFKYHALYGNKWADIAQYLIGRTDNSVKNHFYSTIRKFTRKVSKGLCNSYFELLTGKVHPPLLSDTLDKLLNTK